MGYLEEIEKEVQERASDAVGQLLPTLYFKMLCRSKEACNKHGSLLRTYTFCQISLHKAWKDYRDRELYSIVHTSTVWEIYLKRLESRDIARSKYREANCNCYKF